MKNPIHLRDDPFLIKMHILSINTEAWASSAGKYYNLAIFNSWLGCMKVQVYS